MLSERSRAAESEAPPYDTPRRAQSAAEPQALFAQRPEIGDWRLARVGGRRPFFGRHEIGL